MDLTFGVAKRRAVLTVGYAHGFHTRPSVILYRRLRQEVPKAIVKVRVLDVDGVTGPCGDARNLGRLLMLRAKSGDRIEVKVAADTQDYAKRAIAIAREVLEATDDTLPYHYEAMDFLADRYPGVADWIKTPGAGTRAHDEAD